MTKRRERAPGEPFDLAILGGGIVGAGIARDAALRGLRVLLCEKTDWGAGTSSKSSKMIHGGLRYLEHGELGLVFESVSERAVLRKVAPHLVRPLPFLVPVYRNARPGLEMMNIGLWIYDSLALFRSPKLHKTFRGEAALALEPALRHDGLTGAIEYYDCVTDDARLVLENVIDAAAAGADCRSYTRVIGVDRDERGRIAGVRLRDELTGVEERQGARCLVVAAGPWTDEVLGPIGVDFGHRLLRRTKGVHAVFPSEMLPLKWAITLLSHVDQRVMFAIPWRGRTVIGTTDTDFTGSADEVHADAADVKYLCDSANRYFPRAGFKPEHVIATWSGLRPLIDDQPGESASDVSREHQVFARDDGVVVIAGGKLTTYRRMAKEVVRKAIGYLQDRGDDVLDGRKLKKPHTRKRPLPGAAGLENPSDEAVRELAGQLARKFGLAAATADHLADTYGTRARVLAEMMAADPALARPLQADVAYVWAEIEFAFTQDRARTLDDVLSRRVPLLLVGREQGLDVVEEAAARLAARLGWSAETAAAEVARYRETVADSRRFRG